ncbi:tetratricopeptide repeat protein [Salinicola aestuarinus]|uniref:tetratricopeptide repeat protein n=1 Tax=Salinicola aestuarinus TaxID=1949082 RepID=UPI000DA1885F|nr:tetratricopeptide repeat protein [Salinicola aestuarinus]
MSIYKNLLWIFLLGAIVSVSANAEALKSQCLEDNYKNIRLQELVSEASGGNGLSSCLTALVYANGDKGEEKDFEKAFEFFKKSYEQGFFEGAYYLGVMYKNGFGVDKDFDQYIRYMTEAGNAGYLPAQKKLLAVYLFSREGKALSDDKKAAYWLKKAADLGDEDSMYNLSGFYLDGRGVEQNDDLAFHWIMQAVERDDILSFERAGDFYSQGIGTEQDWVRAYMMYDLGGTASSGKKAELAEQMTQEQINEAISLSRQWQEEHNSYRPSYHGLEAQGSDGHYEYH